VRLKKAIITKCRPIKPIKPALPRNKPLILFESNNTEKKAILKSHTVTFEDLWPNNIDFAESNFLLGVKAA
jgi:hypothetical protein